MKFDPIKYLKKKEAWVATGVVIILAFILSPVIYQLLLWQENLTLNQREIMINKYIQDEVEHLGQAARTLSQEPDLIKMIEGRQVGVLGAWLKAKKEQYKLGGLLATDKDGLVLARAKFSDKRGDYIFQSTVWGEALSRGQSFVSKEKGQVAPFIGVGAVPLMRQGQVVGSVVATYIFDDAYALEVRNKYMPTKGEVAFYQMETGLTGASFSKATRPLLEANFNTGSEWFKNGLTNKRIELNGQKYFVQNIPLLGLEGQTGGLLAFWPDQRYEFSLVIALVVAGLLAGIIFYILRKKRNWQRFLKIAGYIFGAVFLGGFMVVEIWSDREVIKIEPLAFTIYNSTMAFEPQAMMLNRDFTYSVAVKVMPSGENINTVSAIIDFDPALIKVEKISTTNSVCADSMFLEKSLDNIKGQVRLVCVIPNPGISTDGLVAELLVRPLLTGQVNLNFNAESQVLANDGLGTNVLRAVTSANITIFENNIDLKPNEEKTAVEPLLLFSSSHPNQEKWYNNRKNIKFSWSPRAEDKMAVYVQAFNKNLNFVPTQTLTLKNSLIISAPSDGVYYFHLGKIVKGKLVGLARYKVMIDGTAPDKPQIKASSQKTKIGEVVWFDFTSQDATSGLQPNYYFKLDGGLFLPVKKPLYLSFDTKGSHTITIRVFDRAENYSESKLEITVKK